MRTAKILIVTEIILIVICYITAIANAAVGNIYMTALMIASTAMNLISLDTSFKTYKQYQEWEQVTGLFNY